MTLTHLGIDSSISPRDRVLAIAIDNALDIMRYLATMEGKELVWVWNIDSKDELYIYRSHKYTFSQTLSKGRFKAFCWENLQ